MKDTPSGSPASSRTESMDDITSDPHRHSNYVNLWKACMQRDITRVKSLIEECDRDINRVNEGRDIHVSSKPGIRGRAVSVRSEKGLALIHWLAQRGYNDVIKVLFESGLLEVSKIGRKGDTALHCAARHGHVRTVRDLLRYGSSVSVFNKKGNTALIVASMYGFTECVDLLLEAQSDVNAMNNIAETALHWGARRGEMEIVEALLEVDGIIVDHQSTAGETPFHCAVKRNSLECVKLLLKKGVNANLCDTQGNLALHLALEADDTDLVQMMYEDEDIDVNKINLNGDTCLHIALKNSNHEMTKWLLEQPRTNVNIANAESNTPLHMATRKGHFEIVKMMLVESKVDMGYKDADGRLPIHLALENSDSDLVKLFMDQMERECVAEKGQEDAAKAPLQTDIWRMFLEYKSMKKDGGKGTPLRTMIQRMPDEAEIIFDKCIGQDKMGNLRMNHDFIDDTFSKWESEPYSYDFTVLKYNHPMKILEICNRKQLLEHPLLLMLLRKKWQAASIVYFSFLLFYAIFVGLLSTFMMSSHPPFLFNVTNKSSCILLRNDSMQTMMQADMEFTESVQSEFEVAVSYVIYILSSIGMLMELAQLIVTKRKYLEFHNLLDWFTYIGALLVPINFNICGIRTAWQWQLGSVTVFIAWMNMLFFLRRLPQLGLFVVMISMILQTFIQFFIIFFLFVMAFSITFYLLLQNQFTFMSPLHAIVKSWVMMFGEMDYVGIFHTQRVSDSINSLVPYEDLTFVVFVCFLIMITLIVMNLLVGLAVSDVEKLQKNSVYEMLSMQIDLALDVELSLPWWLHKRMTTFRYDENNVFGDSKTCIPPWCDTRWWKRVKKFFQGPLYSPGIIKEAKEILRRRQRPSTLKKQWSIDSKEKTGVKVEKQIKELKTQMTEIHTLLKQIAGNNHIKTNH